MRDDTQSWTITGADGSVRVHELKCWPPHWDHVATGGKTVEIRRNDRDYQVGDVLVLWEWSPPEGNSKTLRSDVLPGFTGRVCLRMVTHVFPGGQFGLADGYVALSIKEAFEIDSTGGVNENQPHQSE